MLKADAAYRKDMTTKTTLQHRHFAVIAQTIAKLSPDIRTDVARHFANELAGTNPNFNRNRFLKAAGIERLEYILAGATRRIA